MLCDTYKCHSCRRTDARNAAVGACSVCEPNWTGTSVPLWGRQIIPRGLQPAEKGSTIVATIDIPKVTEAVPRAPGRRTDAPARSEGLMATSGPPGRRRPEEPGPHRPPGSTITARRAPRISARSQSRMSASFPVAASILPSGENATPASRSAGPPTWPSSAPVATPHSRTAPSSPAVASNRPSGENATGFLAHEWLPIEPVPSPALQVPEPDRTLEITGRGQPAAVRRVGERGDPAGRHAQPPRGRPVARSQRKIAWSLSLPEARDRPSGANARQITGDSWPRSRARSRPAARSQSRISS